MEIPIRNIYYMILYAFNKIKNKSQFSNKAYEPYRTASDVIVSLFLQEISEIVKTGIYKNYIDVVEHSVFIKGKIQLRESIRNHDSKKIIEHDDFSPNINENMILKYTLNNLVYSDLSPDLRKKARLILPHFSEVELITHVDNDDYRRVVIGRQNENYEFSLALSIFINKNIIPSEQVGKLKFIDIIRDDEIMSTIYEEFLRSFYRLHTNYQVNSKEYSWYLTPLGNTDSSWLPIMKTDIEILTSSQSKIIIDAKFYKNALSDRYEMKKLSSNNMYQMNTYLVHNLQFDKLRGILLYPSVGYHLNLQYEKDDDFSLEFMTIDLSQNWEDIHDSLLKILQY